MTEEATLQDDSQDEYIEEVTESATEEETTEGDVSETDINQESVNKAINRKHFQMKEAERHAEAEKQRAEAAEARLRKLEEAQASIEVPDIPDPYEDDYDTKVLQRDQIIRQRAEYEFAQKQAEQQAFNQQKAAQEARNAELQKHVKAYSENAVKLGVTPEALQEAGNAISPYMGEDLSMAILRDPEGALITTYLASNFAEVEKLGTMSLYDAGQYVANTLKAKASALKPKQTNAPKPSSDVRGGNVDPTVGKYPHSQGATFE